MILVGVGGDFKSYNCTPKAKKPWNITRGGDLNFSNLMPTSNFKAV